MSLVMCTAKQKGLDVIGAGTSRKTLHEKCRDKGIQKIKAGVRYVQCRKIIDAAKGAIDLEFVGLEYTS